VEEDSSGYPDCRESFYQAYQKAVELGTKDETRIQIETPIIHKRKCQIIQLGQELGAPLQYSWSCYQSNEKACGVCDSCRLRIKAFKEAGIKDPIPYQIDIDW
jgi:7-cyano-7-deazaguanine synthase